MTAGSFAGTPAGGRIVARANGPQWLHRAMCCGPPACTLASSSMEEPAMSPVARWLRLTLLACVAAVVMSLYAPAEQRDGGWAPEAVQSTRDAEPSRG